MNYWRWATAAGAAGIVVVYFVGVGVGERRAGMGVETKVVTVATRDTREEERLRRELAAVTARKNNVTTVERIVEVPGGERVITRTIRDTSTEDVKATAVEVREVVKVERVTVKQLIEVKSALPRYGIAALTGVDLHGRFVVGATGEYKWMRVQAQATPGDWARPTVLIGAGFRW